MISSIRSSLNSIYIKILLILIILSFVFFGVSGSIFTSNSNFVAKIDDQTISLDEFFKEFSFVKNLREYSSKTPDELKQIKLADAVLKDMISKIVVLKYAEKNNISVSPKEIGNMLVSVPYFKDENGEFSEEKFDEILNQNGINKNTYLRQIKTDLIIKKIFNITENIDNEFGTMAKTINNWINMQKDIVVLTKEYSKKFKHSKDEINQYYNSNAHLYKVPMSKNIEAVYINKDKFNKKVKESDVKDFYNKNIKNYATAIETRDFYRVIGDENILNNIINDTTDFNSFKKSIAKNIKDQNIDDLILKHQGKDEIPDENLANAVFSTQKGNISNIIDTDFGKMIVFVSEIYSPGYSSYEKFKEQAKDDLISERIYNSIDEFYSKIINLKDSGKIKKIAKEYSFTYVKHDNFNESNNNVKDLSFFVSELVTNEIMENNSKEFSEFNEFDNKYISYRIVKTNKAYTKKLDTVKFSIIKTLNIRKNSQIAKKIKAKLDTFKSFNEIKKYALKNGFKIKNINNIKRNVNFSPINNIAFQTDLRKTTNKSLGNKVYSVFVKAQKIGKYTNSDNEKLIISLSNDTKTLYINEFVKLLRKNYDIQINKNKINEVY